MDDLPAASVRFILYMTLGLGFGLSVFGLHALDRDARKSWSMRIRGMLIGLALGAIGASVLGMAVMASRMFGIPLRELDASHLVTVMELPGFGLAISLRAAALGTFLLLAVARIGSVTLQPLLFAVALATLAWFGHGAASIGDLASLHLASTVLHLLAAGLWLGAIAAFLLIAIGKMDRVPSLLAGALQRFHRTGSLVVALLLATGLFNAAIMLGWNGLIAAAETEWGRLMALKLLGFAAMLGLATLNRFRLAPAFTADGRAESLANSLRLELLLATAILFLVGWLGLLSPSGD